MESNFSGEAQTFLVHPFTMDNYKLICEWWEVRNFPHPSAEHLPPTGYITTYKGMAVACGFMFKTDANVAVIGHLVSNPSAPKILRQPSVDFLINFLTKLAQGEGFTMVACSTNIDKLGKRFEKIGFKKTDENVSMYGRIF